MPLDVSTTLGAKGGTGRQDFESETFVTHALKGEGHDASEDGTGRGVPLVPFGEWFERTKNYGGTREEYERLAEDGLAGALGTDMDKGGTGQAAAAGLLVPLMGALAASDGGVSGKDAPQVVAYRTSGNDGCFETGDRTAALTTASDPNANVITVAAAVRRLTPRECERLQGFPDDYTLVPIRRVLAADGPRYKALGNSIAVPCLAHIGRNLARALGLAATPRKDAA